MKKIGKRSFAVSLKELNKFGWSSEQQLMNNPESVQVTPELIPLVCPDCGNTKNFIKRRTIASKVNAFGIRKRATKDKESTRYYCAECNREVVPKKT